MIIRYREDCIVHGSQKKACCASQNYSRGLKFGRSIAPIRAGHPHGTASASTPSAAGADSMSTTGSPDQVQQRPSRPPPPGGIPDYVVELAMIDR